MLPSYTIMKTFNDPRIPELLSKALHKMGYITPTPIQNKSIPEILAGKDLIGLAQTGTGKTAAFGIPIVSWLIKNPKKVALILAPTRELAAQIEDVFTQLTSYTTYFHSVLVIGGVSINPQKQKLFKKPSIIIATPGRLLDHISQRSVDLSHVGFLVLDEADRMLDMGFAPQLSRIKNALTNPRQTLLFSATMPASIGKLAHQYLRNPVRISIDSNNGELTAPPTSIIQDVIETTNEKKKDLLLDELKRRHGTILIFARTKSRTDNLAKFLTKKGYEVGRIHGNRSQNQRKEAIAGFKTGKFQILVATDIAARGLDIPEISHVINFDVPRAAEDYIHRIGRTARMGIKGHALSFVAPDEKSLWRSITRLLDR